MKDIKCPSCGKTFRIDPSSFEEILLQIKDEEFNKQIKERLLLAEEDNKKALEILKRELKIQLMEQKQIKENQIKALESKLNITEEKKKNALNDLRNQATTKINTIACLLYFLMNSGVKSPNLDNKYVNTGSSNKIPIAKQIVETKYITEENTNVVSSLLIRSIISYPPRKFNDKGETK